MSQEIQKIVMPYRSVIICASLLVSLALHQLYVALASPQVPYMDTMMFFVQIDHLLKGEISWLNMYGSGEHRGLLYPLVTFVEWKLWGVDARITTKLTGIVVAATFYFWLRALLNAQVNQCAQTKKESLKVFIFCVIAAAIIVSPAGFELWTLDLGFAQLIKNLLIVHFLYLLAVSRWWTKNVMQAFVLATYGGFLILFAAYGWSYPFLIACLFILLCYVFDTAFKAQVIVVIVVMLIAQLIYVYSGHGVFSSGKSIGTAFSITALINGIFYGAGTVFIGMESMEKMSVPVVVPLLLGAVAIVVALLALLITFFDRTKENIFLSGVTVFALTVLAGVAVARGMPDFVNTGSSRYFVDYVWILLAPLAIIFTANSSTISQVVSHPTITATLLRKLISLAKLLATALLFTALVGHVFTWTIELKTAPFRAVVFNNMADIYRKGVTTEADAALLQSPFPVAQPAVLVAHSYNLSVLRNQDFQCTLKNADYTGNWYSPGVNNTRWMGKQGQILLGNCPAVITMRGYIPENFKQRSLKISYGVKSRVITVEPGKEFSFRMEKMDVGSVVLTLDVDHTTSPLAEALSADERELGILLTYIGE